MNSPYSTDPTKVTPQTANSKDDIMKSDSRIDHDKASIKAPQTFDFGSQGSFRKACADLLASDQIKIIEVDFDDVHFIDSTALGVLLLLRNNAEKKSQIVSIINCHEMVMDILKVANFHRIFSIHGV